MKKLLMFTLIFLGCGQQNASVSYYPPSENCTIATVNNTTTVTCPDGTHSTIDELNFVQFCPGQTTYPNEFNEIGICYLGNLYAVYSIPGAFLTLITPGLYESNAIGSSCTFIVQPNCIVIDQ
jgi:hypothetical protein